jgi:hypothetical protein
MSSQETNETTLGQTRPCPFCAEPILAAAKKCKHCGEFLESSPAQQKDLSMACPRCQSEDWKLASLVYNEGRSSIETKSNGAGIGISGGGIGAGIGGATTSGTQQTVLSKLAAPPDDFVAVVFLMGGIVFGFLWIICFLDWIIFNDNLVIVLWCFFLLAIGCIVGAFKRMDSPKCHIAMEKWSKKRLCQRCGTFYDPPS